MNYQMLIAQEWLFESQKEGKFNEIDVSVVKFMTEMRLQGFPVTRGNSDQRTRNHMQCEYQ
jgi:hypothetical protein